MGERIEGYLSELQRNQGYYLEEDETTVALMRFSMGAQDEDGEKVSGGEYNPVVIARVSKDADRKRERLIKKLINSTQR